jgi:ketosteroid isomerase-like protein
VKKRLFPFALVLAGALMSMVAVKARAAGDDAAQIRELEARLIAAYQVKDLDTIMSSFLHGPSLFVFDVIPPRQYVGWDAFRKDWKDYLDGFSGNPKVEMTDLTVVTDGKLGFGHYIQQVTGTLKGGQNFAGNFRITDVYRKINGKWLIVHEHVSVPVDMATAKADLSSKP